MTTFVVTALGAVLAALGAVLVWQRTRGREPASDAIRLITSRYLGGKRFLTLVEVDGERLLLGLAGDSVSLVARLGEPACEQPGVHSARAAGGRELA